MATTDRVMPHSLDVERELIGSLLVEGARFLDIAGRVVAADFWRDDHRKVFGSIAELAKAGKSVDPLTVAARLEQKGELDQLDAVDGRRYLWDLTNEMVRSFNLEAAADIVRDRADRRRLIHAASKIADDAYGSTEDAKVILERAEKQIFDLAHQQVRGDFVSAEQLVTDGMPAIEQLMDTKKGVTGVATGFLDLDLLTRGLQPGALVLLAARPSMGKTSFALNVAHYAATHGTTVGLFSLEMSKEELLMRLVSSVGRIDGHRLQSGYVNQSDYDRISDAFTTVAHSRLFVDDSPGVGVLDMRGKARRLKARAGLDLVIVDYLQLMQLDRAENRNVAVAEASRALKLMARELEVPVVALSQLSRATEQRGGDKKPMLSDLRDSGALEQDADVVLFIHRPEFYHQTPENEGLAEVMIAKQRNGPTGVVKLRWSKAETRFDNWDPARQDDPQLWDGEPV